MTGWGGDRGKGGCGGEEPGAGGDGEMNLSVRGYHQVHGEDPAGTDGRGLGGVLREGAAPAALHYGSKLIV